MTQPHRRCGARRTSTRTEFVSRLQDRIEGYAEIAKRVHIAPQTFVMVQIRRHGAMLHETAADFGALPPLVSPRDCFVLRTAAYPASAVAFQLLKLRPSLDRIDSEEERYGRTQSDHGLTHR